VAGATSGFSRIGAYLSPRDDLRQAVVMTRAAEDLGYESVWVTHGSGRDSFLVLSAYAYATRRIGLGNGVIPIYPRHPVAMAQEAATLAELSEGRFRLGIGVSHRASMVEALGLDMARPLEVMREYVTVLRGALAGAVRLDGPRYRVAWSAAFRPPSSVPVLLAGLSVPMLELAGEVADGVVLWLCAPAYIRDVAVPALARGRARAGRSMAEFEVVAAVPAAATADTAAATAIFREELVRYLGLPFYRAMLGASGFGDEIRAFDRDRASRAPADAVPQRLAGALGAIGDRAAIRASVEAYRAAGVTLPAVRPIGAPEMAHARPTLEAAAP
jgi:alkanesulfonate monooxygenase SsuD/methylene tetrahydromethanopterin reductase-like flavin-dependent oxidoreductase (luciferase family)